MNMQPKMPLIVGPEYKNRWQENLSNEEYHEDRFHLSSSAVRLVLRSPAHFYSDFVLREAKTEQTSAMKFGTLVHSLILEPQEFRARLRSMPDFGDMRSSKNREQRDSWIADQPENALLVSSEDMSALTGITQSVLRHSIAAKLFNGATKEISGYFRDPETSVACRIRPDAISADCGLIDIKTTIDASRDEFSRSIQKYGYHTQLAFYAKGIKEITGTFPPFVAIVAIEKSPPYATAVYVLDEAAMEIGTNKVNQGLARYAECVRNNHFPSYQEVAENISLPNWAIQVESFL